MINESLPSMLWYNAERGQGIERFLVRLATEVPHVAIDMLRLTAFGDFGDWFQRDDEFEDSWKVATCGCLIGSAALCAVKDPTVQTTIIAMEPPEVEAGDILYIAWMMALGRRIRRHRDGSLQHTALRSHLMDIGNDVSVEACASYAAEWGEETYEDGSYNDYRISQPERHALLSQYFQDHLRTSLTLMGIKNLPPRIVFTSPFDE